MQHTGTVGAWMTPYNMLNAEQLKDPKCLKTLEYTAHDMAPDWVKVGTAEITVTFCTTSDITASAVDALRKEQQTVRADAEVKAMDIERRIQTLLAITHEA